MRLRGHEVLDERVCGLSVERERVLQRLQLVRLGHVGDLETCTRRGSHPRYTCLHDICALLTVTARVEVLLDLVQAALQHRALLRGQALLTLLQIVLAQKIILSIL